MHPMWITTVGEDLLLRNAAEGEDAPFGGYETDSEHDLAFVDLLSDCSSDEWLFEDAIQHATGGMTGEGSQAEDVRAEGVGEEGIGGRGGEQAEERGGGPRGAGGAGGGGGGAGDTAGEGGGSAGGAEGEHTLGAPTVETPEEVRQRLYQQYLNLLATVTDQGSNVTKAFSCAHGSHCVCHGIHNEVKALTATETFAKALKKLKKIVQVLRRSLRTWNEFKEVAKRVSPNAVLKPQTCGATRWTATYVTVGWGGDHRTAVQTWLGVRSKENRTKAKDAELFLAMALTSAEWDAMALLRKILKPLAQLTVLMQGTEKPTLHQVIPMLAETLRKLRVIGEAPTFPAELRPVLRTFERDLLKRLAFEKSDSDNETVDAYIVATVLTPCNRRFDRYPAFRPGLNAEEAAAVTREHWKAFLQRRGETTEAATTTDEVDASEVPSDDETEAQLMGIRDAPPQEEDELESYLQEHVARGSVEGHTGKALMQYWFDQRQKRPKLAEWASEVLSRPASSAGPERIFSLAGRYFGKLSRRTTEATASTKIMVARNYHLLSFVNTDWKRV
eukprot:GHVU01080143.1.p1 GENE.GHVU01080143.1~~GHVU01080143.1.p1  ORF type:complete len:559 (-),score=93.32 GHVU01080143.1:1922-3598(-)